MKLKLIQYEQLNARQKEAYNFQKVSAILADYGFMTIRLSDDWQGADFIAQHVDGQQFLKVQLKGRCHVASKYVGKNLYLTFSDQGRWYLVPHDHLLDWLLQNTGIQNTESWKKQAQYSFPNLSLSVRDFLEPFLLKNQ